ncbi:hypothetical protein MKX03_036782, partial [Papaver bracteatum]
MKEAMKNCIVRKTEESTSIRIDDSNHFLMRTSTDQPTTNPSPYRMPHQFMISPPIPLKIHPPPARYFHRVTEEGVRLRRKSLAIANMAHKLQNEAKDRARTEHKDAKTKASQ